MHDEDRVVITPVSKVDLEEMGKMEDILERIDEIFGKTRNKDSTLKINEHTDLEGRETFLDFMEEQDQTGFNVSEEVETETQEVLEPIEIEFRKMTAAMWLKHKNIEAKDREKEFSSKKQEELMCISMLFLIFLWSNLADLNSPQIYRKFG